MEVDGAPCVTEGLIASIHMRWPTPSLMRVRDIIADLSITEL